MNPEDAVLYTAWINDIAMSVNLGQSENNYSLAKEREFLEKLSKEGHNYAIVSKDGDTLIGNCSLFSIDHIHQRGEIGIFIGEEKERGKGYGVEALEILVAYGFKVLNLKNIMLRVFSYNQRAIRCYEKAGFKVFGRRTRCHQVNGQFHDEIYMEILADEFKPALLNNLLP